MNLPKTTPPTSNLNSKLDKIGLRTIAQNLDDFIARATTGRWSPHILLEQLSEIEADDRSRRSLERRLGLSGIKKFKPMADFDWSWPKKIERDVIERALTLDFIKEGRNLVMIGQNGLGKSMIAKSHRANIPVEKSGHRSKIPQKSAIWSTSRISCQS